MLPGNNKNTQQASGAKPAVGPATQQWDAVTRSRGGLGGFRLTPKTQKAWDAMVQERWREAGRGTQWSASGSPIADMGRARSASTGQGMTGAGPAPQPASGGQGSASLPRAGVSYQTGINPNRDAINKGDVLGRAGKEARMAGGTGAAADFARGQIANDRAQLNRGLSLENAQQNMVEQANRSEMFQAGLSMQADMMNKMAAHRASQVGFASDMMQALMRGRGALMNSLLADGGPV